MDATYLDLTSPKISALVIKEMYDDVAIQNSLKNIFSTPLGSLPGKPYFGTRIHQMLFEPIDEITMEIMTQIISEEVTKFEPRITLGSITFDNLPEYNKIVLSVEYSYKRKEQVVTTTATIPIQL